jgi:hypothetical protein
MMVISISKSASFVPREVRKYLKRLLGVSREVAGSFYRSLRGPPGKLLGASREVAGSLSRSCWDLLKKFLGASG